MVTWQLLRIPMKNLLYLYLHSLKIKFSCWRLIALERLETWAGDERDNMAYVQITGSASVRGIGNEVYLGLNIGTTYYKEFVPEEIQRLKTIVAKLDSWRPLT